MKIAISGKGGVGKTLLASLLSRTFAEAGYAVLAIDADPDSNLAATLGFPHPDEMTPISEMSALIEERTGAKPGEVGSFFKLSQILYSGRNLKSGLKLIPLEIIELFL